jgi:hypothetical protein
LGAIIGHDYCMHERSRKIRRDGVIGGGPVGRACLVRGKEAVIVTLGDEIDGMACPGGEKLGGNLLRDRKIRNRSHCLIGVRWESFVISGHFLIVGLNNLRPILRNGGSS